MKAGRATIWSAVFVCFALSHVAAQVCKVEPLSPTEVSGVVYDARLFDDRQNGSPRMHVVGSRLMAAGVGPTTVLRRTEQGWEAVPGAPAELSNRDACVLLEGGIEYLCVLRGDDLYRFDGVTWTSETIPCPIETAVNTIASFDEDGDGPGEPHLYVNLFEYGGAGPLSWERGWLLRYEGGVWLSGVAGNVPIGRMIQFDADGVGPELPALYIAGYESQHPNSPAYPGRVVRLQGGVLTTVGAMNYPNHMAVHDPDADGPEQPKLYVGGGFTEIYAGVPIQRIAAWDGSSWSALGQGLVSGAAGAMASFDEDGSGPARPRLIVSGTFTRAGGDAGDGLAAWDGEAWSEFGGGLSAPAAGWSPQVSVLSTLMEKGGPALLLGGNATIDGRSAPPLAIYQNGEWLNLLDGPGGPVLSLALFNEGQGRRLFAAGRFRMCGDLVVNNIARWESGHWSPLGEGVVPNQANPNPMVMATAVYNDGSGAALYVGGSFRAAGTISATNIARWTGQAWERVGSVGLSGGPVHALEAHDADGPGPDPAVLYAGGSFTFADAVPVQHLAVWDGQAWSAVPGAAQTAGAVRAIRSFTDSLGPVLYVGGDSLSLGGHPGNLAFRMRGGVWEWLPPLAPGRVNNFAYHNRGDAYRVYALGEHAAGRLALLNGAAWLPVTPDRPQWAWWDEAYAARSIDEGGVKSLYANGLRYRGMSPGMRLEGEPWGPIRAISPVFDDGSGPAVYMAGDFQRLDGVTPVARIARLPLCSSCYPNCDASTAAPVLDVSDFTCFLRRFAAGNAYANCDGSSAAPVLNVADYTCFLQRFAAGCP